MKCFQELITDLCVQSNIIFSGFSDFIRLSALKKSSVDMCSVQLLCSNTHSDACACVSFWNLDEVIIIFHLLSNPLSLDSVLTGWRKGDTFRVSIWPKPASFQRKSAEFFCWRKLLDPEKKEEKGEQTSSNKENLDITGTWTRDLTRDDDATNSWLVRMNYIWRI